MYIATNTEHIAEYFGDEETIRLLAENGFTGIDWSFFRMDKEDNQWNKNDFRERAQRLRAVADDCGIRIVQAHAPFPTGKGEVEYDCIMRERILRSIEIAAIMGAENIIVHPYTYMNYQKCRQELFDENVCLYKELIPYCEKWNIHVCTENMWTVDHNRKVLIPHMCAQPEEFCTLIDAVDSPWIGACLDIGHAAIVSVDPVHAINALGKKRLRALHVHDVDYLHDSHMLPFTQKLDWEEITAALKKIGYRGAFTFEAGTFIAKFPKELWKDVSLLMAKTGQYLGNKVWIS